MKNIGLIGLGLIADSHLAAYQYLEGARIVAGADFSEDRRNYMTEKWGFKVYKSAGEMLKRESLDLVCIFTPPAVRRELTELAASHGVHVLCEKPLALSLEDCQAIIDACTMSKVKLYYGSSYRHLPPVVKAKEMIEAGELGKVNLVMEIYVGGKGPESYHDLGAHHYPTGGPGGGGMGLVDHGIHFADIIPWLVGSKVKSVFGRGNLSGGSPAPEYATMIMENGAVGQLLYHEATFPTVLPNEGSFSHGASWSVNGELLPGGGWDPQPGCIQVYGDKGALRIFHYANRLYLSNAKGIKQIPVESAVNPHHFRLQLQSFLAGIEKDAEPVVGGLDGLKALAVILAAYESHANGTLVNVGQ